ncbi:MAG TPA: BON domain-containing protein, partial [Pirellulales bacterium]|nr:BON domain-containing protein [Pirellulales bacterium]
PRAIDVDVADGLVALAGPVLTNEMDDLIAAVASVRGVRRVENHLEPHPDAADISGLQGGRANRRRQSTSGTARATPASRLLTAMAGGVLIAYGTTKRFPIACVLGTIGLGLIARATGDVESIRGRRAACQQASRQRRPARTEASPDSLRDVEPVAPEVRQPVSYDL